LAQKVDYFPPFDAIEIKQGEYTFYVISMNSRDLLRIAYTSPRNKDREKGVQRDLDTKRLKEIGEYYQNPKKPGILPNSIIVSLSKDSRFERGKLHIPKREHGEAFVLDGQHRLYAFLPEYVGDKVMDLLVSAFIDLNDEMKAYIFRTINMTQRKINPSLVFDLVPMLRDDWVTFEDLRAKTFLDFLNNTPSSPWYDGVAMLGGRERPITQASFITRLKKGNVFENKEDNEFFEEIIQINLLVEYFQAVREIYPKAWNNSRYILCKNTGFAAMLNLLKPIIDDLKKKGKKLTDDKGLVLTKEDFRPYFEKVSSFSFSSAEYGSTYLGEAGIRDLTEELKKKIFG
jgi:DGQHR domain-containing protein